MLAGKRVVLTPLGQSAPASCGGSAGPCPRPGGRHTLPPSGPPIPGTDGCITVAGPVRSRARPESLAGVNDGRADRDFQGGTTSGACPAGEYGHRLRQAAGLAACRPGDGDGIACAQRYYVQTHRGLGAAECWQTVPDRAKPHQPLCTGRPNVSQVGGSRGAGFIGCVLAPRRAASPVSVRCFATRSAPLAVQAALGLLLVVTGIGVPVRAILARRRAVIGGRAGGHHRRSVRRCRVCRQRKGRSIFRYGPAHRARDAVLSGRAFILGRSPGPAGERRTGSTGCRSSCSPTGRTTWWPRATRPSPSSPTASGLRSHSREPRRGSVHVMGGASVIQQALGMPPASYVEQALGIPPASYVEQVRIGAARRVLVEGGDPVHAIARRCGFSTADLPSAPARAAARKDCASFPAGASPTTRRWTCWLYPAGPAPATRGRTPP